VPAPGGEFVERRTGTLTPLYDVLGVRHCRGLVETLSESLPDKGPWACVMAAGAGVYLLQQLTALVSKDAPHEYASYSPLVELTLDKDERLRSARDVSSLHLVGGELSLN
jgi:hypothetical protein